MKAGSSLCFTTLAQNSTNTRSQAALGLSKPSTHHRTLFPDQNFVFRCAAVNMSRHPAGTLTIKLKSFTGFDGEDGLEKNAAVYFEVVLGHERVKTKVHENIGRSGDLSNDAPIVLHVTDKEAQRKELVFKVFEQDTHDDHLAVGELPVADAIMLAQTTVKLQPKGQLSITMEFEEAPVHHNA